MKFRTISLKVRFLLFIAFLFLSAISNAQKENGGIPRSFLLNLSEPVSATIAIATPDLNAIMEQDKRDAGLEKPYRVGVSVSVDLSTENSGTWEEIPGGRIWRISLKCSGAEALGIDYSRFYLPEGCDLFIYNRTHTEISGAFTAESNPGERAFSTRPLRGDEVQLEYYQPSTCRENPDLELSGIVYMYRGMDVGVSKSERNFGGSGSCEVNVHCPEGEQWKSQAQGVVRILARVGSQSFWCTGALLNNTRLDFSPLILTANHCSEDGGSISSAIDLNKWIFYFNYESSDCANPSSEPVIHSLVGATQLASSESATDIGSDFYLVKLNKDIPPSYFPYYNGWNTADISSPSGTGIHHPEGDIKKISTYTSPLASASWGTTDGTHWKVQWSPTENGFGITEAGSSGSPIFDNNGLIVGTLTGGESACTNTSGFDFYGKVAFSWQSNGATDTRQLKPWLDPLQEGRTSMQGAFNDNLTVADFEADTTSIGIGSYLDFHDRSLGNPTSWHWHFPGGTPSESTEQNPSGIFYEHYGNDSVILIVSNEFNSDTLIRVQYIKVKARIYPNPSTGKVFIFLDPKSTSGLTIDVFNETAVFLKTYQWNSYSGSSVCLDLPSFGTVFFLRMKRDELVQVFKAVVIKNGP